MAGGLDDFLLGLLGGAASSGAKGIERSTENKRDNEKLQKQQDFSEAERQKDRDQQALFKDDQIAFQKQNQYLQNQGTLARTALTAAIDPITGAVDQKKFLANAKMLNVDTSYLKENFPVQSGTGPMPETPAARSGPTVPDVIRKDREKIGFPAANPFYGSSPLNPTDPSIADMQKSLNPIQGTMDLVNGIGRGGAPAPQPIVPIPLPQAGPSIQNIPAPAPAPMIQPMQSAPQAPNRLKGLFSEAPPLNDDEQLQNLLNLFQQQ